MPVLGICSSPKHPPWSSRRPPPASSSPSTRTSSLPRCAGASVRRTRTGRQQADCHHRRRAAAQRHTRPSMLGRRGRVRSTYGSMIRNRAFKIHLRYYLNPDTPRIHVFYRIHSTRYITIQQDTYPIGNPTKKVGPPPLPRQQVIAGHAIFATPSSQNAILPCSLPPGTPAGSSA